MEKIQQKEKVLVGKVFKIMGGEITVQSNNLVANCELRGNIKKSMQKICVGDNVEFEENAYNKGKFIITKVLPRKNALIRPNVANLDQLVIVATISPQIDFNLIDKLVIYCIKNNITPLLVINKCELMSEEAINTIANNYRFVVKKIIVISALNKIGLDNLRMALKGKCSAFAGQSAVGKSTILNSLNPSLKLETNGLSEKIERGKHTTRHSQIYALDNNIQIVDTPGFSMLSLKDIDYNDLHNYYPEFKKYCTCTYLNCTHINCKAKECGVVRAYENHLINSERYERYCKLFNELKLSWENKYD